jgi:hypothetical protein
MQASVRILSVLTFGAAAVALVLAASTPAALAYDGPTPQLIKPVYGQTNLGRGGSEGPVELPHPVEPPTEGLWVAPGATTSMTPEAGGKFEATHLPSGALPVGRGGGAILAPSARAERSIRQLIRRLG